jgi:uncharacterized protein YwgA
MADIVKELKAQAEELCNLGNSKEQAEGHGMMKVLEEIGRYYYGFQEYDTYFDSISDEEKPKLNKKLKKLKIY